MAKGITTVILAAGKGVRMKSAMPKVAHPVCGKPLIEYVLEIAAGVSAGAIYVVVGHKRDEVIHCIAYERRVRPVMQRKLLGTADALRTAQRAIGHAAGDILVLSGDAPLINRATVVRLIRRHRSTNAACSFVTAVVDGPRGYGRVVRDGKKNVIAIREEKDATPSEKLLPEINAGIYCFNAQILRDALAAVKVNQKKKEYYLTDCIDVLVRRGVRIETIPALDASEALGINTREDLARAHDIMRRRIICRHMKLGVTITDPQTTYIDAGVRIGCDTTIRSHTVIEKGTRIGSRCTIGPFCHIRPSTRIGNNVLVGNFTELSRSFIGDDCFVSHFSFLGDAVVGRRVNIGAGVVTANFDGRQKRKTVIFDDAFIGSDSILIAPVTVGKKAVTGAGAVVTRGQRIPDGSVAVGVPAKILPRRKE